MKNILFEVAGMETGIFVLLLILGIVVFLIFYYLFLRATFEVKYFAKKIEYNNILLELIATKASVSKAELILLEKIIENDRLSEAEHSNELKYFFNMVSKNQKNN